MLQGCKKFKYFKLHKRLPEKNGGKTLHHVLKLYYTALKNYKKDKRL